MAEQITFSPAVKAALKARVAFCGPTGSGKTWTALGWAAVLGQRVALIDTEKGSAALYADHFKFDTLRINAPYHPQRLIDAIAAAEQAAYDVIVIDSLSHFWEGEGGVLEVVDAVAARSNSKNKYVAWGVGTPLQRKMVDAILDADAHLILTMRSKMEYVQEKGDDGKTRITRIGLAPVQRQGVEYEFTVIGDLDLDHRMVISKSRCDVIADLVIQPHGETAAAKTFRDWLATGEPAVTREVAETLVRHLNMIEDDETRSASKRRFAEVFGRPQDVLASRADEAVAWVNDVVTRAVNAAPALPVPEPSGPIPMDEPRRPPIQIVQSDPQHAGRAVRVPGEGGPVAFGWHTFVDDATGVETDICNRCKHTVAAHSFARRGCKACACRYALNEEHVMVLVVEGVASPDQGEAAAPAVAGNGAVLNPSEAAAPPPEPEEDDGPIPNPASEGQFRAIHAALRDVSLGDDARHCVIALVTGSRTMSSREISSEEAGVILNLLGQVRLERLSVEERDGRWGVYAADDAGVRFLRTVERRIQPAAGRSMPERERASEVEALSDAERESAI